MYILELILLCSFEPPTSGTSVTISATKCNTEQRVNTCHRGCYMQQKAVKQLKKNWSAPILEHCYSKIAVIPSQLSSWSLYDILCMMLYPGAYSVTSLDSSCKACHCMDLYG